VELLVPGITLAQNPATAVESPAVHVIGTTPIPGLGTPIEEVPTPVQSLSAREIERRPQPDLPSLLEQGFSGVSVSNGQGNAHQAEVVFRGFSASPLLGAPQGISVFLDGIRANEAFGDNVNWDLIPANAIATAHLISGSKSKRRAAASATEQTIWPWSQSIRSERSSSVERAEAEFPYRCE